MVDPLAIIGLVSAIVQFVDFGSKIVVRLNEYRQAGNNVPKTFQSISVDLPLVIDNLKRTKNQADAGEISNETANALKPVVEACLAQTKQLEDLLEKALPAEGDSTWRRRKKALASLAHGTAVQEIMSQLESHLRHVLFSQVLSGPIHSGQIVVHGTSQPSRSNTQNGRQPLFMLKFARDKNFVGREDILKEIDRRFLGRQPCVAIAGVGGVGKSQIAIEYCYRYRQDHPEAHIFWVHASNSARFAAAYHRIGEELALPDVNNPEVDTIELVQKWLSNDANGPWLLVLDNADNIETVFGSTNAGQQPRAVFNYLPRGLNGSMIVTTRDRRIGQRLAPMEKPVTVLPFEMKEAQSLLQKTLLEDDLNSDHSMALSEALDFLPMAIAQAAAFIRENDISMTEYLGYLRASDREAKDLLAESYHDAGRDPESRNSIFQTWKISFDCIRNQTPRAAEILALMAVLDRQAIQKCLLRKDDERDIDFATAIGALKAFSLITEETAKGTFSMHRLIQLSMQRWLELEGVIEKWQKKAVDTVSRLCSDDHVFSGDWKSWGSISPHAQIVLSFVFQSKPFLLERAVILHRLAIHELEQGYIVNADARAHEALATIQKLEEDHPKKLAIAHTVASLLCHQGKREAAEKIHRQVLEKRRTAFGSNHPETLISLDYVAYTLAQQGKYEEAEELQRQGVEAWTSLPDPATHRFRLSCFTGLANTLEMQCKYEEAEKTILKAIDGLTAALGARHPSTIYNLGSLASVLMKQDKLEAAEAVARRALQDYECSLGPQHVNTLRFLGIMAAVLERQDKLEEAETLRRRAFEGLETLLGPKDRATVVVAIGALACTLARRDKYREAESMLRRGLRGVKDRSGPEEPSTLSAISCLAHVLEGQGKWEEAERLRQRVFHGCESLYGPGHEETLRALANSAYALEKQEKHGEAESVVRQALRGYEDKFGSEHPIIFFAIGASVPILEMQEKWEEAERLRRQAFHGLESLYGPEHVETLRALVALAYVLDKQDKYQEAESALRQALRVYEDKFGPEDQKTLITLSALAPLLERQAKFVESEAVSLRAFRGYEIASGPKHPYTVLSLAHVAVAMVKQGKFEAVEAMCRPLLDGFQEKLGSEHLALPALLDYVADALANLGKYEEAEPLRRQTSNGFEKMFGIEHPQTLASLEKLAFILEKQNKFEAAEVVRRRVLEIQERVLGPEHSGTVVAVYGLAWVLHGRMEYDQASVLYQRAWAGLQKTFGLDHSITVACSGGLTELRAISQNQGLLSPRYFPRLRRLIRSRTRLKEGQGRYTTNLSRQVSNG